MAANHRIYYTGNYLTSGSFDETAKSIYSSNSSVVFASQFDEVTFTGNTTFAQKTASNGTVYITGIFDEVLGVEDPVTTNLLVNLDAGNRLSYTGSGTSWTDLNANNSFTLSNITFSSNLRYFTFNGTNSEATSTNSIQYTAVNTTNWTLAGWFRTTSSLGKKIVGFETAPTGTSSSGYDKHVFLRNDGKLTFGVYNGLTRELVSSQTVNDGNWYYFVASYNYTSSNCQLYINGNLEGTINHVSTDSPTYLRIGSYVLGDWTLTNSGYFAGDIAGIQFYYGTSLNQTQAQQNYKSYGGRYGVNPV